jgi:RNA polymerase sigma-70 factor (ECF subfamily)
LHARIPDRFRDVLDAEDLLQDVLVAASARICETQAKSPAVLRAWLFTIATNKLTDSLRAVRCVKRGSDLLRAHQAHGQLRTSVDLLNQLVSTGQSPRRHATVNEAVAIVEEALALLPDGQRVALELRFKGGLCAEQIAVQIGNSVSGVRGLVFRGLRSLRKAVGPRERLLSTRA